MSSFNKTKGVRKPFLLIRKRYQLAFIYFIYFGLAVLALSLYIRGNRESMKTKMNTTNIRQNENQFNWDYYYNDGRCKDEWIFSGTRKYNIAELNQYAPASIVERNTNFPGEMGASVKVPLEQKSLMTKLYKDQNFNILASDMMSLHRSLPDMRYEECKNITYPTFLPTASLVIIFHNEPWSTLLRTVWSIINRSPKELIHEIILVDDLSDKSYLQKPLDDYIELIAANIRLIRTKKRHGLIRARLLGAQYATGDVVIFLDAHIECTEGWLEPILTRIAYDRSVVAVPHIDGLSSSDLAYVEIPKQFYGFSWNLIFKLLDIPQREMVRRHYDKTAPFRTPTMVGCAFAIDRNFFFEIGAYDVGMDIWGAENLEMALRVWRCGGALELIPCSHVGHLYRISTYSFDGDQHLTVLRNNKRLVEVWMDEFKEYYYAKVPEARHISAGDLSIRESIKTQLKCRSFRWFLEQFYPENEMLVGYHKIGQFKNIGSDKCLDLMDRLYGENIGLYNCHGSGGNQALAYQRNKQIVYDTTICLDVTNLNPTENDLTDVKIQACDSQRKSQKWRYNEQMHTFLNLEYGKCLTTSNDTVYITKCNKSNHNQKWVVSV